MLYSNVKNQIPDLVDKLNEIQTEYSYERGYVGQAISYLILLKDILEDIDKKETE